LELVTDTIDLTNDNSLDLELVEQPLEEIELTNSLDFTENKPDVVETPSLELEIIQENTPTPIDTQETSNQNSSTELDDLLKEISNHRQESAEATEEAVTEQFLMTSITNNRILTKKQKQRNVGFISAGISQR